MKKRILAFVLSAVMLAGETLPVMAQNDIAVVSDEAEETVLETEDEVSEDAEETEEIVEADADAIVVEETTEGSEAVAAEAADEFAVPVEFEGLETVEKNVEYDEEAGLAIVTLTAKAAATADAAEVAGSYYQLGGEQTLNIPAGTITANDKTYDLNTNIKYFSITNYRMRKIKAVDDLKATVVSSGLVDMAKDMTTTGTFTSDVIKFKFSEKKNKNAGAASFTVKASVDKKIAKALGITGKPLKALKKAAKQFSKAAKSAKASFTIYPADFQIMNAFDDVYVSIVMYYNLFTRAFVRYGNFALRGRLEENAPSDKSKWKKIPSKDYKKKIVKVSNGCNVTITPKGKNLVGTAVTYELR